MLNSIHRTLIDIRQKKWLDHQLLLEVFILEVRMS